jgi:hypothetical protein
VLGLFLHTDFFVIIVLISGKAEKEYILRIWDKEIFLGNM